MPTGRPIKFWEYVDQTDDCWLWTGPRDRQGYGKIGPRGFTRAHRYSFSIHNGPIPEGMTIDHLCRVPACVNPAHLEAVTKRENTLRGTTQVAVNATKTICVSGHAFDEANTYHYINRWGNPARACRSCNRAAQRRAAR